MPSPSRLERSTQIPPSPTSPPPSTSPPSSQLSKGSTSTQSTVSTEASLNQSLSGDPHDVAEAVETRLNALGVWAARVKPAMERGDHEEIDHIFYETFLEVARLLNALGPILSQNSAPVPQPVIHCLRGLNNILGPLIPEIELRVVARRQRAGAAQQIETRE
jgi:hypothetical protein